MSEEGKDTARSAVSFLNCRWNGLAPRADQPFLPFLPVSQQHSNRDRCGLGGAVSVAVAILADPVSPYPVRSKLSACPIPLTRAQTTVRSSPGPAPSGSGFVNMTE